MAAPSAPCYPNRYDVFTRTVDIFKKTSGVSNVTSLLRIWGYYSDGYSKVLGRIPVATFTSTCSLAANLFDGIGFIRSLNFVLCNEKFTKMCTRPQAAAPTATSTADEKRAYIEQTKNYRPWKVASELFYTLGDACAFTALLDSMGFDKLSWISSRIGMIDIFCNAFVFLASACSLVDKATRYKKLQRLKTEFPDFVADLTPEKYRNRQLKALADVALMFGTGISLAAALTPAQKGVSVAARVSMAAYHTLKLGQAAYASVFSGFVKKIN